MNDFNFFPDDYFVDSYSPKKFECFLVYNFLRKKAKLMKEPKREIN